jgi:hypothetical protein
MNIYSVFRERCGCYPLGETPRSRTESGGVRIRCAAVNTCVPLSIFCCTQCWLRGIQRICSTCK